MEVDVTEHDPKRTRIESGCVGDEPGAEQRTTDPAAAPEAQGQRPHKPRRPNASRDGDVPLGRTGRGRDPGRRHEHEIANALRVAQREPAGQQAAERMPYNSHGLTALRLDQLRETTDVRVSCGPAGERARTAVTR